MKTIQFEYSGVVRVAFLMFVMLPLGGCPLAQSPSTAGPPLVHVGDELVHQASGMVFPADLAGFQRASGHVYNPDGRDISVGYNMAGVTGGIVATVYVYPAPSLISIGSPDNVVASARAKLTQMEFARRKREIVLSHQDATLLDESADNFVQGSGSLAGWKAVFSYDLNINGIMAPARSQLFVFCFVHGPWALEYRFTYPQRLDASPAINAFMQALRVTI